MPVAVKKLYLASNINELKKKSEVEKIILKKEVSVKRLTESFQKLYTNAKDLLNGDAKEKDEETIFMYLFRAMELWQYIMTSDDYKTNKEYFKLMHGKDVRDLMDLLDSLTKTLTQRYEEEKNVKTNVTSYKNDVKAKFQLGTSITIKKRKEAGDIKNSSANGVDNHNTSRTGAINQGDFFVLETDNNFIESSLPEEDFYGDKKFIPCKEFREMILGSFQDVLVLDTRPKSDFNLSKIKDAHCVNIPETSIIPGLSANKLGGVITDEKEKFNWSRRDKYKQVVLMDWSSEEKDVIPNSPLDNLLNILVKWDPSAYYKNKPLILSGGYECMLDTYPLMLTNSKIQRPKKKVTSAFVNLRDHVIDYPLHELEELAAPKPKLPVQEEKSTPKPTSGLPTIDRSTKPEKSKEKLDNSQQIVGDSEEMEVETTTLLLPGKLIEEQNGPTENEEERNTIESNSHQTIKERTPQKKPEVYQPSMPSPVVHPATPPREEKKKTYPSSFTKSDLGDGDGSTYLEKLKFDSATPRSGGLKRSNSSPNINKMVDEEPNVPSKHLTPTFDRSTKPKQHHSFLESYSPRDSNADTIYSASSREGRGLTGLKNFGNVCYLNSIVQCISNTVELTNTLTRFSAKEISSRRQIASEISTLLRSLWTGDTRITSCRALKNRVGALKQSFSGSDQQDAHEFLTVLMDWLHEDLNELSTIKSLDGAEEATGEKAWGEFKKKNNSVVVDLIYGQLKSTVTCDHCRKQSISFEPFSNLSIPLAAPPGSIESKCSIEDCLRLYLKGETISGWVCPNCRKVRDATKKLDITRLPPVLIIHLKRFINDMVGVGWCRKRQNFVEFQINDFNMKPFTHPDSELRFHNYNLYAVSNHMGSMEFGHYTAYCKNHLLGKWYKFDDMDVNEMSPHDVRSASAYILFYEADQFEKIISGD